VLLALRTWASPAPAATSKVEVRSATANLAFVSYEGCVQNEISIFVNQTSVWPGASGEPHSETAISYSRTRFDLCEDIDLGTDTGASRSAHFSADMSRAQLEASIEGTGPSQAPTRISLSLTFIGTGDTHQASRSPGAPTNAKAKVAVRTDSQTRNAWVQGRIDGQDVSGGSLGASLQITRQTITR